MARIPVELMPQRDDHRMMDANKAGARKRNRPSNATRATKLYRSLKLDIIQGALAPREQLRIAMLRKRYDAGASPLREALNRLSAEGFVVQNDQRGFAVEDIPQEDLSELVFTRC